MTDREAELRASTIIIDDGYALIPFSVDDLHWLVDRFAPSDEYRQVIWAVIRRMEEEQP